jgi:LysR family transcriptional regulator, hypochlorite-specific transcription factor HypT
VDDAAGQSASMSLESKWLEDFLSLAETGSFSKSAQIRHVTQPAFSRRIQALEAWLGSDLIDRTAYPTRLTQAGETFRPQALEILGQLTATRSMLRGHSKHDAAVIDFSVPHTLSLTFFPSWLTKIEKTFGRFQSRLTALNVHDAASRLADANADLLIAYHHSSQPLGLDPLRYEMLELGQEAIDAYCIPEAGKVGAKLALKPYVDLNSRTALVPYLGYSSGAYFSRMVSLMLAQTKPALKLEKRYETDMAEGLKAMALQGHGVAFLPESAVRHEVEQKRLVKAGKHAELVMQIRLYRLRPEFDDRGGNKRSASKSAKAQLLSRLWDHISQKQI